DRACEAAYRNQAAHRGFDTRWRATQPTDSYRFSTTYSMLPISWRMSRGSMAVNVATRSWLRPSLRYGSVSTTPLARSALAMADASMLSSKSMVTTTCERCSEFATNGVAYDTDSAQSYSAAEDSRVRASAQASPPLSLIHCTW